MNKAQRNEVRADLKDGRGTREGWSAADGPGGGDGAALRHRRRGAAERQMLHNSSRLAFRDGADQKQADCGYDGSTLPVHPPNDANNGDGISSSSEPERTGN